ncbi:MAG TPA: tetratricopeptide repeat protein [Pyrinomonadaceae bacterium]|nr:tetratricopeptide repeat protein [Pyrinomonadaceae bacterium]
MSKKKFLPALLLMVLSIGGASAQTVKSADSLIAESAIARGNRSFAKADYEAALREYGRVPRGDRESFAQALYNMGVCHYELWHTDVAIDLYRQALEVQHGNYPRASYALGVALEDQGRRGEAKAAYKQSIVMSKDTYALAHYRLGLLISMEGDYEAAAASFRKAIGRAGEHLPASHNNLGVMLARQGRLSEAGREFEVALRQSGGAFEDAAHNLKLCRSLLTTSTTARTQEFKITDAVPAAYR